MSLRTFQQAGQDYLSRSDASEYQYFRYSEDGERCRLERYWFTDFIQNSVPRNPPPTLTWERDDRPTWLANLIYIGMFDDAHLIPKRPPPDFVMWFVARVDLIDDQAVPEFIEFLDIK